METIFAAIVSYIEFGLNIAAVLVITVGGAQGFFGTVVAMLRRDDIGQRRRVWSDFARWLVLALEFELAADLLRTIIAPTWTELGQLAGIAAIRTFLNYFLERDIEFAAGDSGRSTAHTKS
jgi:uncharacterized membrane protein